MIHVPCPNCGKSLKAPPEWAGRSGHCPKCGTPVVLPGAVEPVSAPVAEDEAIAVATLDTPGFHDLVDMTAMVDIVFFLLIFFMVTSMQGVASSIGMPPIPQEEKQGSGGSTKTVSDFEKDDDYLIVRIDEDDAVWLEDEEVIGQHELISKLREIRETESAPTKLLVLGNGDAHHGTVVSVLDAGSEVGIDDIRLALHDGP